MLKLQQVRADYSMYMYFSFCILWTSKLENVITPYYPEPVAASYNWFYNRKHPSPRIPPFSENSFRQPVLEAYLYWAAQEATWAAGIPEEIPRKT